MLFDHPSNLTALDAAVHTREQRQLQNVKFPHSESPAITLKADDLFDTLGGGSIGSNLVSGRAGSGDGEYPLLAST
jgi:hypothetical protein